MSANTTPPHNVTAVVPLLMVTSIKRSLAFIEGLGVTIWNRWMPAGRLRWCRMSLDGIALIGNLFPKGSK